MAKRLEMMSPRAKRDGGTYWHKVGTAWEGDKGINLVFDSLPLPDAEGRCSVSLFEPRDRDAQPLRREAPKQQGRGGFDGLDDDVPF